MLMCLRVKNFAIIDELEVELGPGLNVVTGETGAGKSILVAALQLVLGSKGRADLVRTGSKTAEVEALFHVDDASPLRPRLEADGIEVDDELLIRRVISANGRTRAYVNGSLATATQLGVLAAGLADISSQHEHHTLIDARRHLEYLDAFGELESQRESVRAAYEAYASAHRDVIALEDAVASRADREDMLRYQVHEIDEMALVEGEEDTLGLERERLRQAERLVSAAGGAEEALYARDGSIAEEVGKLALRLRAASEVDPLLKPAADRLDEVLFVLEDVAGDLGRYVRGLSMDPSRLAELEERLDRLARLQRKYGSSVALILEHRERAGEELELLDDHEQRLDELLKRREKAQKKAAKVARQLSKARKKCADALGGRIAAELESLGMGGARVEVELERLSGGRGELEVDGARLSPLGIDRAEFLIAPNPGEAARPLSKVASGGELSRALLAIKRVLAGLGDAGLYVFDEVDSGVGGAVAEVIGKKLVEVARHHQVLCITHLAQIAVHADVQFRVAKKVAKERTRSEIHRLSDPERLEEIARMVGGVKITKRTRAAAAEMLDEARVR